ncbi:MAG: C4-dicarboxylic acid transporter DauA [Coriobacteriales bacterium]|nr:C4-dicarboxylic acid transporter DauA [Coriobacteriales bacterium]
MSHRSHLTTVRFASALRDALAEERYTLRSLRSDALAGLTIAVVAIPLAMALAIAAGAPPQYGLYSAIVAGLVAALTGGSRFSVSGPTAAFVVVLAPVTARYGVAGLATAGLMAGLILIALGVAKLGRLIEYVPEPVTVGFTSGIALVIAILQLNDLLGLGLTDLPEHTLAKAGALLGALPQAAWQSVAVSAATLLVILLWPKERFIVPGYAPAIVVGTLVSLALAASGNPVDTIGSRFTYEVGGALLHGIPRSLPAFALPWSLPAPAGGFTLSLSMLKDLLPTAVSIALLGAIESLLCAVVLDRSTGTRHHSNGELLGQGIANVVAPFFGGIPSTAAIARSSANVTAGARTPLAAAIHSAFVLVGVLLLAPFLGLVPMASMAAVLMVVAWKMSEAPTAVTLLRRASRADKLVFATCFSLTVAVDMVVAITAGIVLAAFLFMRDVARFTQVRDVSYAERYTGGSVPEGWRVVKITGAMFFAAAERVLTQLLAETPSHSNLIIYADGVTLLDAGGIGALERFAEECDARGIRVLLADLQPQPARAAIAAGIGSRTPSVELTPTLAAALEVMRAA